MTPRERAEALWAQIRWCSDAENEGVITPSGIEEVKAAIEAAIIADRRELLAPDEATIEAMAKAAWNSPGTATKSVPTWEEAPLQVKADWRTYQRAALAALRRLKGAE